MQSRDAHAGADRVGASALHGADTGRGGYCSYLRIDELKATHQPRTSMRAEGHFIALHQAAELLLGRQVDELEAALSYLRAPTPDASAAADCLRRARGLTAQLTSLLPLLIEVITPDEFASFRGALGSASGVQSVQFWEVEVLSGYKKTARGRVRTLEATPKDVAVLEGRLASPTLGDAFLALVGSRADDPEALAHALASSEEKAELADALRLHDLEWVRWRAQHALMVEAMIGTMVHGTGGSDGSRYLWSRVAMRFYPILHQTVGLVHRSRAVQP